MKSAITTWRQQRRNRRDMAVLGCLLQGDIYVYDMWLRIGLTSGAIYLSLARLSAQGYAWSDWVEQASGPNRRRYGVTKKALDLVGWESR